MTSITSIKKWVDREEKRLERRVMYYGNSTEEDASLHGSLMTIRKMKQYIGGQK